MPFRCSVSSWDSTALMAIERRSLLVCGVAACIAPSALLASPGLPVLGTWRALDGNHHIGAVGSRESLPLPGRAHDLVATADGSVAFVMARRPGRFLVKVDLHEWVVADTAWSPQGRHVYGHAALSSDESTLYVTENDYETGEGRIGVYNVGPPFKRVDDFSSRGIGPHDILRWPGSDYLVVANGGIRTHPNTGREKLNLETMAPSVVLIDPMNGSLLAQARPPDGWRYVSIRHMDISTNGLVAIGMQWEGDGPSPAPVAVWDGSGPISFTGESSRETLSLGGYVGSVSFDRSGTTIAATSPHGGMTAFWEADTLRPLGSWPLVDVCGLCTGASERSFVVTSGLGTALAIDLETMTASSLALSMESPRAWDNHLLRV